MTDTSVEIPAEYQRPSISKSALIVNLDRANFYRSHINPGKISVSIDETGTKYIDFSELVRVFGLEKCLAGVKKLAKEANTSETPGHTQGDTVVEQSEQTSLIVELRVENERLKAEIQGLKNLSEERYSTILEQREQLRKHFDELQATRRILEDGKLKSTLSKGLFSHIKSIFS
jgi:hypothetical protein